MDKDVSVFKREPATFFTLLDKIMKIQVRIAKRRHVILDMLAMIKIVDKQRFILKEISAIMDLMLDHKTQKPLKEKNVGLISIVLN